MVGATTNLLFRGLFAPLSKQNESYVRTPSNTFPFKHMIGIYPNLRKINNSHRCIVFTTRDN